MRVLLIATYELGRQPFGLASAAAWLTEAGVDVRSLDVSREPFRDALITGDGREEPPDAVAFHLPMHTATRLAIPIIRRVRALDASVRLYGFGLYAPLSAPLLRGLGLDDVLGGEFEAELVRVVCGHERTRPSVPSAGIPRLDHRVPVRDGLPPLSRYATLHWGSRHRVAGYTEASRGCKHRCRHCPIVPVYDGQFRIVPVEVIVEDVRRQAESGAEHITFGDPDFFNGIGHATAVAEEVGRRFPHLTYDVTIKVEHLRRHRDRLSVLAGTGCLFITSAVESFDNGVLEKLAKGHTAADVDDAVGACRAAGVPLVPTFVAFTPWTTLDGYGELLASIARLGLVDHVAPIQLALRLLVTQGSRLRELPDVAERLERFDPQRLVYPWHHRDQRVDALGDDVAHLVGRQPTASRRDVFRQVWDLAYRRGGRWRPLPRLPLGRTEVPYLNEPWYC